MINEKDNEIGIHYLFSLFSNLSMMIVNEKKAYAFLK